MTRGGSLKATRRAQPPALTASAPPRLPTVEEIDRLDSLLGTLLSELDALVATMKAATHAGSVCEFVEKEGRADELTARPDVELEPLARVLAFAGEVLTQDVESIRADAVVVQQEALWLYRNGIIEGGRS
jgi:hypothetical protein